MSTLLNQIAFRTISFSATALVLAMATPETAMFGERKGLTDYIVVPDTIIDSSTVKRSGKNVKLSWRDYNSSRFTDRRPRSPLYLKDPANINTVIRLDTAGKIDISEKIVTPKGSLDFRPGERIGLKEYDEIQNRRTIASLMREYAARQDGKSAMGGRGLLPKLDLPPVLDKFFGNGLMDFKPNGFVSLDLGVAHQFINNPSVPIRQRRNTNFIFNEQININFNAKLGDRMGFLTNFDTKASFNFENALRLNYKPPEESLIRKVEVGNFNWAINSQLIPGVQNLFGLRTDFRFGRLNATVVASQQRSSKQRIVLRGGTQSKDFDIRADTYDENRHFFMSQHFRGLYENALKTLPNVTSGVTITRLEVYVTNRTTTTESLRNVVGFADLGEPRPFAASNPTLQPINTSAPTGNETNGLYKKLMDDAQFRQVDQTNFSLTSKLALEKSRDFELLRGAKKLIAEREYKFNPQLGFISLSVPLRNDEVLAVAYEYTLNGKSYKVGELTEDYQNRKDDEVIVLKLLKSSTLRNNTSLPMWDLMMKNVYALGSAGVDKKNFQLKVIYKDDATGIDNPTLQEGSFQNEPLLRIMGLDRLNPVNDVQPDGNFDYVEGFTIDSQNGRIFFPVLEPFGATLSRKFGSDQALKDKYVFHELYDGTMIDAQQANNKNKFYLRGSYESGGGQTVNLPLGVAEQSVTVTSGGVPLSPGSDYIVEAQVPQVRIVNPSVMNSGREIVIEYELADLFNNQIRSLYGTRLDYIVSKDISVGLTAMKYRETPGGFLTRVPMGNEPANNSIVGFDINIRKEAPGITRFLDKLPLIQTKEMSHVQFRGEFAQMFPGVSSKVNNRSLVDDFEAARTVYDLTRQPTRWRIASTPQQFPQGTPADPLEYGRKRALISVYTIDNIFDSRNVFGANIPAPVVPEGGSKNFFERLFLPNELFPGRQAAVVNLPQAILDVAYYPSERGMYNYNTDLDVNGRLKNPRQNFGAVSRSINSDNDFDNANIENFEFWMMSPFIQGEDGRILDGFENQNNTTGGKLLFNLGDISEDIIPDGRYNFENGLPIGEKKEGQNVDRTPWGHAPRQQYVINAFSNEPGAREKQDIGLDGLNSGEEQSFFKQSFIDLLPSNLTSEARAQILGDPSNDDFQFYLGDDLDLSRKNVLQRYKNYMGMENNSPETVSGNSILTPTSTNLPDAEDLNTDNTINDNEAYYEYEIDISKNGLQLGSKFIVDRIVVQGSEWFLFRVPVKDFNRKIGQIDGFKSIRFMRMYLTEFQQPVVLRFAQLQLVGQQYRKYNYDLNITGPQEVPLSYDPNFTVGTVSVEENSQTGSAGQQKYVYAVPPGWQRDRDYTMPTSNFQLNEQSMSLCVTDLRDNDRRAVYRNVNLDLLFRKRLRMYLHMHNDRNESMTTGAFVRLGTDVNLNYYEIEIPKLKATPENVSTPDQVWPVENELNIAFEDLLKTKSARNALFGRSTTEPYSMLTENGEYKITVVGNPDLSAVRVMMIGLKNPKSDDLAAKSFCIWVNEMHVEGFDQTAGNSGIGQLNLKLADLATVTASGRFESFGFGSVQSKIGERSRDATTEFGISSNIQVDKFMPQSWGFNIPLYVNYDKRLAKPHFDPLDPDMPVESSLDNLRTPEERMRYRRMIEDNTVRRGINLSNVRKVKTNPGGKNHFYDFENLSFTYAFSDMRQSNILTESYVQKMVKGGIAYAYSSTLKPIEPFKKWKTQSPWFDLIKGANINPVPSVVFVSADVDRSFIRTQLRNKDLSITGLDPFFEKYFWFNRRYDLTWNLTKNATLVYNSMANSIVDEPAGDLNTSAKRDSVWNNFKTLGRIKNFNQKIDLTYRLPLDKLPLTDWMSADYTRRLEYDFMANAFGATDSLGNSFGNVIRNRREWGINGRVDFVTLYNKLKYLRFANSPAKVRRNFTRSPGDLEEIGREPSRIVKDITRVLMTVRGINVGYTVVETTALPGYLRSPRFGGVDNTMAPGLPFVFGQQDRNFQKKAVAEGWVTPSTVLNQPFQQTIQRTFTTNTTLEPFRDFRVQIAVNYKRQDAYQEFYRPLAAGGEFVSQSPLRNGQFEMSFLSFKTAFAKINRDNSSPVYDQFKANRSVILQRLENSSPEAKGKYNENSQDVLIPAFFAAYSGRDVNQVKMSPFLKIPMPNWELNYNGLSQVPLFKTLFSTFNLTHKYTSIYSVGNFTSSLDYNSLFVNLAVMDYKPAADYGGLAAVNALGQYIPVFAMSTITMTEKFGPVLGISFQTRSKVTGRLDYNRDRSIALNLSNAQLAELFNQDVTFNLGVTRNGFPIPFKINGARRKLKNDLTAQLTMTFRDTRMIQRKFGVENGSEGENIPISGNINFQLRPSVSYVVNNQLSLNFYFDRTFNDPLVTNSFYRSTTAGGVQIKFNLAQ